MARLSNPAKRMHQDNQAQPPEAGRGSSRPFGSTGPISESALAAPAAKKQRRSIITGEGLRKLFEKPTKTTPNPSRHFAGRPPTHKWIGTRDEALIRLVGGTGLPFDYAHVALAETELAAGEDRIFEPTEQVCHTRWKMIFHGPPGRARVAQEKREKQVHDLLEVYQQHCKKVALLERMGLVDGDGTNGTADATRDKVKSGHLQNTTCIQKATPPITLLAATGVDGDSAMENPSVMPAQGSSTMALPSHMHSSRSYTAQLDKLFEQDNKPRTREQCARYLGISLSELEKIMYPENSSERKSKSSSFRKSFRNSVQFLEGLVSRHSKSTSMDLGRKSSTEVVNTQSGHQRSSHQITQSRELELGGGTHGQGRMAHAAAAPHTANRPEGLTSTHAFVSTTLSTQSMSPANDIGPVNFDQLLDPVVEANDNTAVFERFSQAQVGDPSDQDSFANELVNHQMREIVNETPGLAQQSSHPTELSPVQRGDERAFMIGSTRPDDPRRHAAIINPSQIMLEPTPPDSHSGSLRSQTAPSAQTDNTPSMRVDYIGAFSGYSGTNQDQHAPSTVPGNYGPNVFASNSMFSIRTQAPPHPTQNQNTFQPSENFATRANNSGVIPTATTTTGNYYHDSLPTQNTSAQHHHSPPLPPDPHTSTTVHGQDQQQLMQPNFDFNQFYDPDMCRNPNPDHLYYTQGTTSTTPNDFTSDPTFYNLQ